MTSAFLLIINGSGDSITFHHAREYKVLVAIYPLSALFGYLYDKHFCKLHWTVNYTLSILAVAATAIAFKLSVVAMFPYLGKYVYILLPLPAYGLIIFSTKMFHTGRSILENLREIPYMLSVQFKGETKREKIKSYLVNTMKAIACAIMFVLFAWWLSSIEFHKTSKSTVYDEPIVTSKGDTIKIDDAPEPSRLKIEIKKANRLDDQMNMIDVYTALITIDTTLQPEVHRIPDNVSTVIIQGCDEHNGVTLPKNVKHIRLVNCRSLKKVKYPANVTESVTIEGGGMERIRMPFTRNLTVKNCMELLEIYSSESIQYKFSVHAYNCPWLDVVYLGEVEADTLLLLNCPSFNIEKSLKFYKAGKKTGYSYNKYHLCKHLVYDNYKSKTLKIGDVSLRDLTIRNSPEIKEMSFGNTDDDGQYYYYPPSHGGFDKITVENCPNVIKYNTPPGCEFSFNGWKSTATAQANAFFSGKYMYAKDHNGVKLIAISQRDGDLLIPQEIDGDKVTSVQFLDSTYNFRSVTLPKDFALDVSICGDWIRDVESIKFGDNSNLTCYYNTISKILNNPDSVCFRKLRTIHKYAGGSTIFQNSKRLKTVVLSSKYNGTTEMEFYNCTSLSQITIPDGVQSIGNFAFLNTSLKEVTIPASVTEIGKMSLGFQNAKVASDSYRRTTTSATATLTPGFQINGNCSSAAAKYAADYGITFNAIDNTFTYEKTSDTQCRILTFNGCDNPSNVVIPNKIHGLEVVGIDSTAFKNIQPVEITCLPKGIHVNEFGKMKTAYISNGLRYYMQDGYAVPCKSNRKDIDIVASNGKITASTSSGYITYTPLPQTIDGIPVKTDRQEYKSGDFVYTTDPGQQTCEIIACTATTSTVSIPTKIDGYTVTKIGKGAFYAFRDGRSLFETVNIPPTVEYIDEEAFYLDYFYIRAIYYEEYYYDEYEEDDANSNRDEHSRYDGGDDLTFEVAQGSYAEKFALRHRRSIKYTKSK